MTDPTTLTWTDWDGVFERALDGTATPEEYELLSYLDEVWDAASPTARAAWASADLRERDSDPPLARALGRRRRELRMDFLSGE